MTELHVNLSTSAGQMECFVAHPEGSGPWPAVILYMDVIGIREELYNFARRIAGQGYVCVLPDMFYRAGRIRFDPTKDAIEKMFAIGQELNIESVRQDTETLLDYLDNEDVATSNTGCLGYCMSGQFAIAAAGYFPDRVKAAASLHGVRLVTEEDNSPHRLLEKVAGEIYVGDAAEDPFVEEHEIPEFTAALAAQGIRHQVVTHPHTEHGYSFPERPSYVESAAEKDWSAMFEMFSRNLA